LIKIGVVEKLSNCVVVVSSRYSGMNFGHENRRAKKKQEIGIHEEELLVAWVLFPTKIQHYKITTIILA